MRMSKRAMGFCVGALCLLGTLPIRATAETAAYFQLDLSDSAVRSRVTAQGAKVVDEGPDGKPALRIDVPVSDDLKKLNQFITLSNVVDLASLSGSKVVITALVRAQDVSRPAHSFTGIKVMLSVDSAKGKVTLDQGGTFGTFEWKELSARGFLPASSGSGSIILALQESSGTVWVTDIRIEKATD